MTTCITLYKYFELTLNTNMNTILKITSLYQKFKLTINSCSSIESFGFYQNIFKQIQLHTNFTLLYYTHK